jgi:hypothetical protein
MPARHVSRGNPLDALMMDFRKVSTGLLAACILAALWVDARLARKAETWGNRLLGASRLNCGQAGPSPFDALGTASWLTWSDPPGWRGLSYAALVLPASCDSAALPFAGWLEAAARLGPGSRFIVVGLGTDGNCAPEFASVLAAAGAKVSLTRAPDAELLSIHTGVDLIPAMVAYAPRRALALFGTPSPRGIAEARCVLLGGCAMAPTMCAELLPPVWPAVQGGR